MIPRISKETTEIGWASSRRYAPYLAASFAISLAACWLFWFFAYLIPSRLLVDFRGGFSPEDAHFLTIGLGVFLATTVTPLYAVLWSIDLYDQVKTDMDRIRLFFGERSLSKIAKRVRERV